MIWTIEYKDDAELVAKCRAVIARLEPPPVWKRVGELADMTGRAVSSISRSLHRPTCPPCERVLGPKGSIIRVAISPELLKYLRT